MSMNGSLGYVIIHLVINWGSKVISDKKSFFIYITINGTEKR